MAAKQCSKCGETKPLDQFSERTFKNGKRGHRGHCKACYLGDMSAKRKAGHYREDRTKYEARKLRAKTAKRQRNLTRTGRTTGDWWDRLPKQVYRAATNGREYWGDVLQVAAREYARRVAPKPVSKVKRGPWSGPGLSNAERYRIRYRTDPDFQAREYLKALRKKRARRKLIAESGLPQWKVSLLRIQCQQCAYCGCVMPDVTDRVIDHVIPISKGGPHAWDNLAIVCKPCNARKFNRMPTVSQQARAMRQRAGQSTQLVLIA